MISRKEYIRQRLLELSRNLRFQTFELFFPNPVNNTIEREFFMIRPLRDFDGHVNWNSRFKVLELETKVVGRNRIINTYPAADFSLTKEALHSMEMIIVDDLNKVDISEYSYSHKTAYEDEYRNYLVSNGGSPRLVANVIIPIVERKSHGIFSVMNKYKEGDGELLFEKINDEDIAIIMQFAADLSRDLTYKFGFRKTLIPSIELSEDEEALLHRMNSDKTVIGTSVAFQNTLKRIAKVCFSDDPVLLLGDTGVGKTYFAKLIYKYWQCAPQHKYKVQWDTGRLDIKVLKVKLGGKERVHNQFRNINIAAIPDTLFESEIFGSVKGAATDIKGRFGILVEEHGNPLTVLFDEIGDLSSNNQAKLLKCIEEQEISLVGSNIPVPLDNVRIIAATNRCDILQQESETNLRPDLIYRFKDIIYIPPLNQRIDDIDPLIEYILKKQHRRFSIDVSALEILRNYSYPGNIRELESIVTYAVTRLKTTESVIQFYHLPRKVLESGEFEGLFVDDKTLPDRPQPEMHFDGEHILQDLKGDYESRRKAVIEHYYHTLNKNIAKTAKQTGLSEAHVRRILRS
ncbi:sigma 54-interacting transcriptional regulator [candidate division KSB1 bacterium]